MTSGSRPRRATASSTIAFVSFASLGIIQRYSSWALQQLVCSASARWGGELGLWPPHQQDLSTALCNYLVALIQLEHAVEGPWVTSFPHASHAAPVVGQWLEWCLLHLPWTGPGESEW